MQNTIANVLFILLVTGALFTGCTRDSEKTEDVTSGGSLEESVMEGLNDEDGDDESEDNSVESNTSAPHETTNPAAETPTPSAETSVYKDGTYAADGSYQSPAGRDTIGVTLVIKNDNVVSVSIANKATDPTSKMFQDNFANGISAVVVGKSLASLGSLGAVNGSSLTPNGFEAAVSTIQGLAKN